MNTHGNYFSQNVADPIEAGIAGPWLRKYGHLSGSRMLLFLLEHPDEPFRVMDLSDLVYGGRLLLETDTGIYGRFVEEGFPMVDEKYLAECKKDQIRKIKMLEGALNLGDTKLAEHLRRECDMINMIRKEVMTPRGSIRNFPGTEDKVRMRLYNIYRYLLKLAFKDDPVVYECIKRHTKTGKWFAWVSIPRIIRVKP